jgi:hypothetical protein
MPVNEAHDESLKDFFENEAMDLQFLWTLLVFSPLFN